MNNVSLLPDSELAKITQSGAPGIPGWLALSELKKRQNIRSTAPMQAPQGTVASDMVSKVLKQSGMAPQAPVSSMPSAAPQTIQDQSGIGADPRGQSYASGGMVKHYGRGGGVDAGGIASTPNGPIDPYQAQFLSAGLVPQEQHIDYTPVAYQAPFAPDLGGLDSAVAKTSSLYGKAPDFDSQMAGVDKSLANGHQEYNVGSYINDLVAGILGGKSISPVANFGTAIAAADANERNAKDLNFKNEMAGQSERNKIQSDMLARQRDIANTATAYQQNQQAMADSQAREKYAADSNNAERKQQADQENAKLISERAAIFQRAMAAAGNDPNVAGLLAKQAAARGDKAGAALWAGVQDNYNKQKQAEADIRQKEAAATENLRFGHEQSLESQKANDARELALLRLTGDSGPVDPNKPGVVRGASGKLYDPGSPGVSSAMLVGQYKEPISPRIVGTPAGDRLLAMVKDMYPDYDGTYQKGIQDLRHDAGPGGRLGLRVNGASTAVAHIAVLNDYARALDTGDVNLINKAQNRFQQEIGGTPPTSFDAVKNLIKAELAGAAKTSGVVNEKDTESAGKAIDAANSYSQIKEANEGIVKILAGKVKSGIQTASKVPGLRKDDPVLKQLDFNDQARAGIYHMGYDPDNVEKGRILDGLPGGNGQAIDPSNKEHLAIVKKFKDAAGGDKATAARYMRDFGWKLPEVK